MFQFLYRLAFLSTFCLSNRTPKITRILTLYQANAPTLTSTVFFKIKLTPKLIIFRTHNVQTFRHNALINKVLLMKFYLFKIRPKLHHRKLRKLCITVSNILNFTSSLLMLLFVQPLSGNSVITCEAL